LVQEIDKGDITSKVPPSDAENMASMAGLIVGCFSLILSLFHMGFIQNVISGYLLSGFLLSVSNLIIVSQVRSLTGMTLVSHETIGKSTISLIVDFIESSDKIHYPTFCFSIGCLVFLGILKALKIHTRVAGLKRIPRILLLFCSSLALSYFLDFRRFGIRTLEGFSHMPIAPKIVSPVPLKVLSEFFPNFITITIIGFIQIASRKPSFGGTSTAASSGDRELFALGLSNVIGSCFGSFPTFGSLPRSHIQAKAGGKTNLLGVMSALIVFFLYNYAYQILYYLPQATIAAIVFDAALNLINVKEISFLVKTKSWPDIGWFLISWGLTFFLKISTGLMLCLLLATLLILRRATTPNLAFLARLDAADSISFIDLSDHPHAILEDDILILAVQGPLEFYNISRMRQEIEILSDIELGLLEEYDDSKKSPQFKGSVRLTIILNFKACRTLDSAALYVLHQLVEDYKTRDIRVILCYFQFDRNPIDQNGLLQLFGANSLAKNIDVAIDMAKSGTDLMHVEF
jgi:SulP family sulfate permease